MSNAKRKRLLEQEKEILEDLLLSSSPADDCGLELPFMCRVQQQGGDIWVNIDDLQQTIRDIAFRGGTAIDVLRLLRSMEK
jgi:hypothetical protein